MEWLCWVFGALVLITLVGHGFWVVLASLFGASKPKTGPKSGGVGAKADLSGTEVQLRQLLDAGLIDGVTYGRVISALATVRGRGVPAANPPPMPVLPALPALVDEPVTEVQELAQYEAAGAPELETLPNQPAIESTTVQTRPPKAPATPRPPRRPFSEVFAAFLRESNIRWGELVGGLLIVGCSVALVISFWSQIAAKPFFQFGLFTSITAATLALGLYAEHRWKLPTTSRGILLIATMLVPLNFLGLAALSHGARTSVLVSAGEVAALALFGFLIWHAARVIAPYWPNLLAAGVVLISASLLIAQQFGGPRSPALLLALGMLPVAAEGAITAAMLRRAGRWKQIRVHGAEAIFLLLGVLTFATALNFGLLIFPSSHPFRTAHDLSALLSLAAAPAMACGLLLWRRVTSKRAARSRTAGTAVAVAATFLMLGCLAPAWPDPRTLLPLAVLDLLVFTLVALLFVIPVAHAPAAFCAAIVYLLTIEMIRGRIGWSSTPDQSLAALLDGCTGIRLVLLFAIFGAVAWMQGRAGQRIQTFAYGGAALAAAVINLGFTAWYGFGTPGDPHALVWVCLVYSAASLLAARHLRRPAAGWAGCVLLASAFVQFFLTRTSVALPWPTALLAYASVAVIGSGLRRKDAGDSAALLVPIRWTAIVSIALATLVAWASLSVAGLNPVAVRLAWVAALCGIAAAIELSEPLFILGQVAMALAAVFAAVAKLSVRHWFAASAEPLLDPWTLQAMGAAMALICLVFSLTRRFAPNRWIIGRWLDREFAFDRILSLALAAGFAALAVGAFAPGFGLEFAAGSVHPQLEVWSVHAGGWGSWLLGATLLATLLLWLRGRLVRVAIPAVLTLTAFAGVLWAAGWSQQHAAASAARWALAVVLLSASIPLWLRNRFGREFQPIATESQTLLAVLAALPILAISIYAAGVNLEAHPAIGPDLQCFFGRIGTIPSYLIPLIIVAGVFVTNALRQQSAGWAFAGSGVCNLAASVVYILSLPPSVAELGSIELVRLVQINVIAMAVFALAWQGVQQRYGAPGSPTLLRSQIELALFGNAFLLVPGALAIALSPGTWQHLHLELGEPMGWVALVSTLAAAIYARPPARGRLSPALVTLGVMAGGVLIACNASARLSGWTGYHVLMVAMLVAGGANLGAGAWIARTRRGWIDPPFETEAVATPNNVATPSPAAPLPLQYERADHSRGSQRAAIYVAGELLQPAVLRWTGVANAFAVLLSFRAMAGDPQAPWWSAGITALIALLWAALACWIASPRLLYAGGLLLNLAATFWFVDRSSANGAAALLDLGLLNITVLSVSGLAALVLHLHVFGRPGENAKPPLRLPFHRFASIASLIGLVGVVGLMIAAEVTGADLPLFTWAAILPSLVLALALLWDPGAPYALAEAYALGLLALAAGLHELHYFHQPIQAAGAVGLSVYVLITDTAYAASGALEKFASGLGMPALRRDETSAWLTPASIVLIAASLAMAFGCDFLPIGPPLRLAAASAVFMGIVGLVLVSRLDQRVDLRYVILGLLPVVGVAWAWAWVLPTSGSTLLRSVVLLAVFAMSLIVFAWIATRPVGNGSWPAAARRSLPPMAAAWAAALLVVLGIEMATAFSGGAVSLAGWAIAIILLNLIAGAAAGVLLALTPARDPLRLSPERRGGYIYAAETMLALSFVHLRLTLPWLFGGVLAQYWPLLVMALAFGGVALGEVFRRKGTLALSSPLFRTGAFLPLLPVIAFWAAPSRVDLSTLLFAVGVFYAILSATRRSFAFGVLAALAANGGLWALLAHQPALAFLVHPQVWLIPAAASVLIAAQLNRDRLSPAQLRFVRYCCLMIVYVSSTADIFLNGVKDHPWLPLVLAALSVVGVLLGILFRLRAFLFLGTAFLGLSILTMIYYASADLHWTWLWYVAGIGLGASILVLFALFEKKRAEMLALVEGLKRWE